MKRLLRHLALSAALFSLLAGCDLFNPDDYAQDLTPVDSMTVFHNLINAYNTLDYEAFLLCLDLTTFRFIHKDTTQGEYYEPWGYDEETDLTFLLFEEAKKHRQIPQLTLRVDTTEFTSTSDSAFLRANYILITPLEGYDTLGGGFELELIKRGNYWYVSTWKDVEGDSIIIKHDPIEDTITGEIDSLDVIYPYPSDSTWGDLKVHFRMESG